MNKPIGSTKKTSIVRVMAEDEERRAWEVAAAAEGRSLSSWVRKACADALKAGA
jgi:predicted HicB family RNase H-like nuclease